MEITTRYVPSIQAVLSSCVRCNDNGVFADGPQIGGDNTRIATLPLHPRSHLWLF